MIHLARPIESVDPLLIDLFEMYRNSNLRLSDSPDRYAQVATEFIQKHQLQEFPQAPDLVQWPTFPIEQVNVSFPAPSSAYHKLEFWTGLNNLFAVVKAILLGHPYQQHDPVPFKFERQAIPPMEAFDYVGHNELNIRALPDGYVKQFE